jgi:hypothetical protein
MSTKYAIQDTLRNSLVLVSGSKDIILMSWPAYETENNYSLVRFEKDSIQIMEKGGTKSKISPQ